MIIIADSGSTKTDWCIGNTNADCHVVQTSGINPFYHSASEIGNLIASTLVPQLNDTTGITAIFFYGAGCTPENAVLVKEALLQSFPHSNLYVESDLLGAARALCGRQKGIACILGTGSNSCAYDGSRITSQVSPLGFILGDEGSGAVLGKRLAADCLKHRLPLALCHEFLSEYKLTPALLLDKVYCQPFPNRFLASFAPFLSTHRHMPEIRALLLSCFTDFFRRNVMYYHPEGCPVHFTGSIAWHFREEVEAAAQTFGLRIGKILKSPIEGLADYHFDKKPTITKHI